MEKASAVPPHPTFIDNRGAEQYHGPEAAVEAVNSLPEAVDSLPEAVNSLPVAANSLPEAETPPYWASNSLEYKLVHRRGPDVLLHTCTERMHGHSASEFRNKNWRHNLCPQRSRG